MTYYFKTSDLVKAAILSALGGVSSTYIGYLGNVINRFVGVPFGAGQILAGLHIFWVMLAFGLTRKPGTCTLVGVLKGLAELFSGGKLGVFVILLSGIQGLIADGMVVVLRRRNVYTFALAGGVSTAANVLVFQVLFAPYNAFSLFFFITLVSFVSGVFFAGVFSYDVLSLLEGKEKEYSLRKVSVLGLSALLLVGGVYYYSSVYRTTERIEITGNVENGYTFLYEDFAEYEVAITAEMRGQYKYEQAQEYRGIPLSTILERAGLKKDAKRVRIVAKDGYTVEFPLDSIGELIITKERRLIAKGFEGSFWVRDITEIQVI